MGLKVAGAKLMLKGGLLNRTLRVAAMRSATQEFARAAANGYPNYARASIALAAWTRTDAGLAENTAALEFPEPTADSTATPTHWALYSAATGGTLYAVQALAGSPEAPVLGSDFGFAPGTLELARAAGAVTGLGMKRAYESGLVSGTTHVGLFANQPSGATPTAIGDRVGVAAAGWAEDSDAANQVRNAAEIGFGQQSVDQPRPVWAGLFDASTGGNLLWEDQLDSMAADPGLGATITIAAEAMAIGFAVDS